MRKSILSFIILFICSFPLFVLGQHAPETATAQTHHEPNMIITLLEWIEYAVDFVGIAILCLGFVKGIFFFLKMELENLTGHDTFDEILKLRSTLGGYIILALDFLIIADIIHSVILPTFNDLLNLGIIVVLRTAIGFFLGRELMELRHSHKEEENEKKRLAEETTH